MQNTLCQLYWEQYKIKDTDLKQKSYVLIYLEITYFILLAPLTFLPNKFGTKSVTSMSAV